VTKDGRIIDCTVTQTNATESQQKTVLLAVRKARYAPRFQGGEPADTHGVRLRERLLTKKARTGSD
jgi:hypothetical protein